MRRGGMRVSKANEMRLLMTSFLLALLWFCGRDAGAEERYPPPRFAAADRVERLKAAFPAIDEIFRRYAMDKHVPGMVWGIVIDGETAHIASFGVQDLVTKTP